MPISVISDEVFVKTHLMCKSLREMTDRLSATYNIRVTRNSVSARAIRMRARGVRLPSMVNTPLPRPRKDGSQSTTSELNAIIAEFNTYKGVAK